MTLDELPYVFSDGNTISFQFTYETKEAIIGFEARKKIKRQKFEVCSVRLAFSGLLEINIFEDFPTNGGCTDVTLIKLDDGNFYLSLDPYGNSGLPHVQDNWIIKARSLVFHDENGIMSIIS